MVKELHASDLKRQLLSIQLRVLNCHTVWHRSCWRASSPTLLLHRDLLVTAQQCSDLLRLRRVSNVGVRPLALISSLETRSRSAEEYLARKSGSSRLSLRSSSGFLASLAHSKPSSGSRERSLLLLQPLMVSLRPLTPPVLNLSLPSLLWSRRLRASCKAGGPCFRESIP